MLPRFKAALMEFRIFRAGFFVFPVFWLSGFLASLVSGFLAFWLLWFLAFWLSGFFGFRISGFLASLVFGISGFLASFADYETNCNRDAIAMSI